MLSGCLSKRLDHVAGALPKSDPRHGTVERLGDDLPVPNEPVAVDRRLPLPRERQRPSRPADESKPEVDFPGRHEDEPRPRPRRVRAPDTRRDERLRAPKRDRPSPRRKTEHLDRVVGTLPERDPQERADESLRDDLPVPNEPVAVGARLRFPGEGNGVRCTPDETEGELRARGGHVHESSRSWFATRARRLLLARRRCEDRACASRDSSAAGNMEDIHRVARSLPECRGRLRRIERTCDRDAVPHERIAIRTGLTLPRERHGRRRPRDGSKREVDGGAARGDEHEPRQNHERECLHVIPPAGIAV